MKTISVHPSIDMLALGVGTPHPVGYASATPQGFAYYVIICFRSSFVALTSDGEKSGRPGDCIVFEPGFPQWHTHLPGAKRGFVNDWCHIAAPELAELLSGFELPVNTIVPSGNPSLITHELTAVRNELRQDLPLRRKVIDNSIESVIIKISRAHLNRGLLTSYSPTEAEYYPRFIDIREALADSPTENWTLTRMAAMVNLSPNRFSVLYRKFFGRTPLDELLSARIELAKYHLLASTETLEAVADACGFGNVYYFSRVFKQRVGCPPGKFRHTV